MKNKANIDQIFDDYRKKISEKNSEVRKYNRLVLLIWFASTIGLTTIFGLSSNYLINIIMENSDFERGPYFNETVVYLYPFFPSLLFIALKLKRINIELKGEWQSFL